VGARGIKQQLTEYKLKKRTTTAPLTKKQLSQRPLHIRTISIYTHSQVHELKESLFPRENNVILIARLTPILSKDIKACTKLLNDLYLIAIRNNYSVFRLGEERIMVVPAYIHVEEHNIVDQSTSSTSRATATPSNI
jgi:SepF-like predicted cell division protein (DUF552 family)